MLLSEKSFGKISPLFWIISLVKLLLSPWGNIVNNTYQELKESTTKRAYKLYVFKILVLSKFAFLFIGYTFLFLIKQIHLNIYNLEFVYFTLASVEILLLVKVFFLVDNMTNKLSWIYMLWFGCNMVATLLSIEIGLFLVLNVFIGVSIFLYAYVENILILGGAGFIGSNTANALVKEGHIVKIIDKLDKRIHEDLSLVKLLDPSIDIIIGNVENAELLLDYVQWAQ